MIKFENITKIYKGEKKPAVDNLSLEIEEGEICMIIGPSGCGKTTTMKMINKLIEPTEGTIYINGEDISKINPIDLRLNIGYVIQGTGLFPHMKIEENIAVVPKEKNWDKGKIDKRIDELLELVELENEYRESYPKSLSGGQRQRVGVARALAADPPIMLMDEPFGALDPITRRKIQDEFLDIQKKIKKTIVFVTHDIDEAIKMGDKIAVMRDGELIQFGTPEEVLADPADEFVEDLIGANGNLKMMNLIRCKEVMNEVVKVRGYEDATEVREEVEKLGVGNRYIAVVGEDDKLKGFVRYKSLVKHEGSIKSIVRKSSGHVNENTTLNDALSEMFSIGSKYTFVVNNKGKIKGAVNMDTLLEAVGSND